MRNLNNFYFSTQFIQKQIENKRKRSNSIIAKVLKSDGNFVSVALLKSQYGINKIENVPIVHSLNNYTAIEQGSYGILLNLMQSSGGFFVNEQVSGDFLDIPEYVFLPILAKNRASAINSKNSYFANSEGQSSIMLDSQEGITIKTNQKANIQAEQNINIKSNQQVSINATMPLNLNDSNLGNTLTKLAADLTTLQAAVATKGITWNPTCLSDLIAIIQKIK